jgi:hypothetical protein
LYCIILENDTFIGISSGINGKEPKFILGFVTKCKPITQSLFPTRQKVINGTITRWFDKDTRNKLVLGKHLLLGILDEYGIKILMKHMWSLEGSTSYIFSKLVTPFKHKHRFILFLHKSTHNGYEKMWSLQQKVSMYAKWFH